MKRGTLTWLYMEKSMGSRPWLALLDGQQPLQLKWYSEVSIIFISSLHYYPMCACITKDKAIDSVRLSVCLFVTTKIARSWDLGIWATRKPNKSIKTPTCTSVGFELFGQANESWIPLSDILEANIQCLNCVCVLLNTVQCTYMYM